jgi:hypothetical protein
VVDHDTIRVAMRAPLLALVVCSTGAIALSATATGYARPDGSFITDGFVAGMEVTPAGFAANTVGVITYVSALELRIAGGRAIEAQAPARSLTVALPRVRAWEGFPASDVDTPTADEEVIRGRPYIDEQYVPGPAVGGGIGPYMRIFAEPMYLPRVFVPEGYGSGAASKYADKILALYPPGNIIPLPNGDTIHVRGRPAPFPGQLLPDGKGNAGILCTVPLRCQSLNSI